MLNKFHSFTQFEVSAAKPQTLETTGLLSPINPLGLSLIYILYSHQTINYIAVDEYFDYKITV